MEPNQYYIYKVSANGLDYFGSSKQIPYERKAKHYSDYNRWLKTPNTNKSASHLVIKEDPLNWTFDIIEYLPLETTEKECLIREDYYIVNFPCVNINRAVGKNEEELKAYKTEWAKNNRRAKGIPKRKAKTEEELKEYRNQHRKTQLANRTPEQIEEDNKKRRETRKELTEEQKEQAKERAKKQREKLKSSTPEEIEKLKEYKKLKAREYRNKKNNIIN